MCDKVLLSALFSVSIVYACRKYLGSLVLQRLMILLECFSKCVQLYAILRIHNCSLAFFLPWIWSNCIIHFFDEYVSLMGSVEFQ